MRNRHQGPFRSRGFVAGVLLALLANTALAQTNQLRGIIPPGGASLPSAQQQLNQSLNRQQNSLSTRQQIESNNRLNHTNQINRNNARPQTVPCPAANGACKN